MPITATLKRRKRAVCLYDFAKRIVKDLGEMTNEEFCKRIKEDPIARMYKPNYYKSFCYNSTNGQYENEAELKRKRTGNVIVFC